MHIRRILYLLITIIVLANTVSCSNSSERTIEDSTSIMNPKYSLNIAYPEYMLNVKYAISEFKRTYKDVDIKVEEFSLDRQEEYKQKITTELSTGGGPDIILTRKLFPSVNKVMSSGIFCDLNVLIAKDKEFLLSEYYESALDAGVFNGKRYLLPIEFGIPAFYTTEDILQKNNIIIGRSGWTLEEMIGMVRRFANENEGKQRYIFGNFNNLMSFSTLMKGGGISFVDYEKRTSSFNSQEFIYLLETYKEISPFICPDDVAKRYQDCEYCMLKNNVIVFMTDKIRNPAQTAAKNTGFESVLKTKLRIVLFPTYDNSKDGLCASTNVLVGINSKCRDKDYALKFIKILLSKNFQTEGDTSNMILGVPINKEAYEYDKRISMKNPNKGWGVHVHNGGVLPLDQEVISQMDSIVKAIDKCQIDDDTIYTIIDEELPDFLNGRKTAKQTAEVIDEKVSLYLNE